MTETMCNAHNPSSLIVKTIVPHTPAPLQKKQERARMYVSFRFTRLYIGMTVGF